VAAGGDERAGLKAGDEEHHAFNQISQEVPEHDAREPGRRGDEAMAVPTDIESGRHCGEDSGAAELLRRPVGDERRQERQQELNAGVADPAA
jgi:hypothetical protein